MTTGFESAGGAQVSGAGDPTPADPEAAAVTTTATTAITVGNRIDSRIVLLQSHCVGEVTGRALVGSPRMPDLGLPEWEATWPQRRERRPSFVDPYYLHYSALVESLAAARDRYVTPSSRILDIGCGDMPYYPLFADPRRGVRRDGHRAGSRTSPTSVPVEQLEIPDASFDLVLCTQVLEHSREPAQALREITRVLRPGGHAFVTTHGIWPFHPYPVDLWRWTQQGLETIVADTPGLRLRELVPHRGTASAFALMASYYVDVVTRRRDPGARSVGRDLRAERRRPRRRPRASARIPEPGHADPQLPRRLQPRRRVELARQLEGGEPGRRLRRCRSCSLVEMRRPAGGDENAGGEREAAATEQRAAAATAFPRLRWEMAARA